MLGMEVPAGIVVMSFPRGVDYHRPVPVIQLLDSAGITCFLFCPSLLDQGILCWASAAAAADPWGLLWRWTQAT